MASTGDTFHDKVVTNGAGDAVFAFPAGMFAVAPVVGVSVQTANVNVTEARVTALTATSCTVNVRSSAGINVALLGLTLLGLPTPLAGATVHLVAGPA
jgi:hypothetical protein